MLTPHRGVGAGGGVRGAEAPPPGRSLWGARDKVEERRKHWPEAGSSISAQVLAAVTSHTCVLARGREGRARSPCRHHGFAKGGGLVPENEVSGP